jgi:hypothetical protein
MAEGSRLPLGVFEREIDPDLSLIGELFEIEYARRYHHLSVYQ